MSAQFEIVTTDAEQPYHARFRGANGELVWSTENYEHEHDAKQAIRLLVRLVWNNLLATGSDAHAGIPIVPVDERKDHQPEFKKDKP